MCSQQQDQVQYRLVYQIHSLLQTLSEQFGCGGSDCTKYPTGISYAPVTWKDINEDKEYNLKFCTGFVGYKQCPKTFELEPVVSWFIGDDGDDDQQQKK